MGYFATTIETALQTGRLLLQNKLYWLLLLAIAGAGVLALTLGAVTDELDGRHLCATLSWWLLGVVLVPWTTMYFTVQAVHGDIEDRTVHYLFLRPVPRSALLLGKWLAVAVVSAATAAAGALVVFAAVAVHADRWADGVDTAMVAVFATGLALLAVVLSAVAALFSAKFRWPLVWSTGYIVFVQTLIGNLPAKAGIRSLAVGDPVRRYVLDGLDPDRRMARLLWPAEREWGDDLIGAPLRDLLVIGVVCLALALVVYVRSEYDSKPRE